MKSRAQKGFSLIELLIVVVVILILAAIAVPAFLRSRCHTSEILTSLMLTYVALLLLAYLINGPMRDPDGYGFPESRLFGPAATLPVLLAGTRLHLGAILALVAAAAAVAFGASSPARAPLTLPGVRSGDMSAGAVSTTAEMS